MNPGGMVSLSRRKWCPQMHLSGCSVTSCCKENYSERDDAVVEQQSRFSWHMRWDILGNDYHKREDRLLLLTQSNRAMNKSHTRKSFVNWILQQSWLYFLLYFFNSFFFQFFFFPALAVLKCFCCGCRCCLRCFWFKKVTHGWALLIRKIYFVYYE